MIDVRETAIPVFRALLIFQKRFPDAYGSQYMPCIVYTSYSRTYFAKTKCKINYNFNSSKKRSRKMRKPVFCICENKDADQLRGNREADQRLCFRYIDSTIPLLS